jgi:Protein of unknown function (DUF3306)
MKSVVLQMACLLALSSATPVLLSHTASAQDGANRGVLGDQPAMAESIPAATDQQSLPDVELLTKDADFTIFMRPEVPEEVRIRALRKLWTTDAIFNEVAPHE